MPLAGFKTGSLSELLLEFKTDALNCSATMAGSLKHLCETFFKFLALSWDKCFYINAPTC